MDLSSPSPQSVSPSPTSSRLRCASSRLYLAGAILLGLTGGLAWFLLNFSLEPAYRGLKCCDASVYLNISENGPYWAWYHSSSRIFGYPFFLAVCHYFFPGPKTFILPAMAAQLIVYFASCIFLVFALRRSGLKVPTVVLTLLLAHPALCGLAAISLSDSLTTSVTSCACALMILIVNDTRYFKVKSLLLGITCGIALSLRLSLSAFTALSCGLVALTIMVGSYREKKSLFSAVKRAATFAGVFLIGFSPLYYHLVSNCYREHQQICVIPAADTSRAMIESFNYAINHSRMWGIVSIDGAFQWGSTDDKFMPDCRFEPSNPVGSLFTCYKQSYSVLPAHFFGRIRGLFDYHHLNPYAATVTTPPETWILRSFSIIGYVGAASCLCLFLVAMITGKASKQIYLLFPALYLALQVHFHAEARYLIPITPILFTVGLSTLCSNPFPKRWVYWAFWTLAIILSVNLILRLQTWDAMSLAKFGHL